MKDSREWDRSNKNEDEGRKSGKKEIKGSNARTFVESAQMFLMKFIWSYWDNNASDNVTNKYISSVSFFFLDHGKLLFQIC